MELLDFIYLAAIIAGWFFSQFIKLILDYKRSKLDFKLLFISGGMPSSHTTVVTTVAIVIGCIEGFGSAAFGLAAVLVGVVSYDAVGVRRTTGDNTRLLREVSRQMKINRREKAYYLALGHTPSQVTVGFLLGIVIGLGVYLAFSSLVGGLN